MKTQSVIVLGAGISGLMDAFALSNAGFGVSVYSKGPDPREARTGRQKNKPDFFSSTHNGELGRFISRFEGEHYLGDTKMYPDMKGAFGRHVSDGGWLGKRAAQLDAYDRAWLGKRGQACEDQKQMEQTERFYVNANGRAMELWQDLIAEYPELFEHVDLLNTGIVRLYDNDELYEWAVKRHRKEGVLERALIPEQVANEYPYFAEACELGFVAGGVEAPGFSFSIHGFTRNLISHLERGGVEFFWKQNIERVRLSDGGLVEGLVAKDGLLTADHYAVNPGAYADESLFEGTPAAGKLAGVAGRWMFMPSPLNFKRPVKIHGDTRTENGKTYPIVDVNLTHYTDEDGKEWLAVGGGYAYLGKPPFPIEDNPALLEIDAENDRTVRRYLGPTYRAAEKAGEVKRSNATCVRSFTYDDVPVMCSMKTASGGVLRINAGTNTGTTTIAPFTAQETVRVMNNG